jgi:hypothetical protein
MQPEASYDDKYPTCVETFAWFRVMGESLDPDTVTARLKVPPTRTQNRGALPQAGSKYPYKYSGWFLESQGWVQSLDARRHLDWLLDRLQGCEEALVQLKAEGNLVDVCVRWDSVGHGGPALSPKQMNQLGALGVTLWFDIYFAGGEGDA